MGSRASKHDKELDFIQETAVSLGLSPDFLESKVASKLFRCLHQAELYNEYAAEDKLLSFQEFNELYKELSSDVFEDAYLEDYVKAVFRAFDSDEDGQLTFKEWRMGYLFLLLLDKEGGGPRTDPADWTKGMEAIYRCCSPFNISLRVYDVDGDKMLTRAEVEHITKVFPVPTMLCTSRSSRSQSWQDGCTVG